MECNHKYQILQEGFDHRFDDDGEWYGVYKCIECGKEIIRDFKDNGLGFEKHKDYSCKNLYTMDGCFYD